MLGSRRKSVLQPLAASDLKSVLPDDRYELPNTDEVGTPAGVKDAADEGGGPAGVVEGSGAKLVNGLLLPLVFC